MTSSLYRLVSLVLRTLAIWRLTIDRSLLKVVLND